MSPYDAPALEDTRLARLWDPAALTRAREIHRLAVHHLDAPSAALDDHGELLDDALALSHALDEAPAARPQRSTATWPWVLLGASLAIGGALTGAAVLGAGVIAAALLS